MAFSVARDSAYPCVFAPRACFRTFDGKRCSLLTDANKLGYTGMHDPVAAIVFGQPVNVDYTVVGGKFIVKEGQLVTVDERKLVEKHNKAAKRLLAG